ncbi:MAG TPA: O-antigen ligase family protein [Chitinophagaceae bacterium]
MNQTFKNTIPFSFFSGLFVTAFVGAALFESLMLTLIPFIVLLFYYGWSRFSAIFYLLIIALPWSIEYSFSGSLGTDLPDEPIMILISFIVIASLLFNPELVSKSVWAHPLVLLLLLHIGWILITVLLSTDSLVSIKYLLSKSWYILSFFVGGLILLNSKKTITKTSLIFIISLLIVCLVIFIHHAMEDFFFININEAVAPFFRNHVTYSAMLVCGVPVLLAIKNLSVSKRSRMLLGFSILFVLAALLFSFSRGAWLALLTGLAAAWLVKKRWLLQSFLTACFFAMVIFCWLKSNDRYLQYAPDYKTTVFHTDFSQHLSATYHLKDVSTAERFYRWVAGIRMIKEKPLAGFGPATFNKNYRPFGLPAFKTWVSKNEEGSTVHNYFLLIAIEQGLPGLFIFLSIFSTMFYYIQHLYHRTADAYYKQILLALGSILVMVVTVNLLSDLIETDKIGSIFFLCMSLIVAIDVQTKNEAQKNLAEDA